MSGQPGWFSGLDLRVRPFVGFLPLQISVGNPSEATRLFYADRCRLTTARVVFRQRDLHLHVTAE